MGGGCARGDAAWRNRQRLVASAQSSLKVLKRYECVGGRERGRSEARARRKRGDPRKAITNENSEMKLRRRQMTQAPGCRDVARGIRPTDTHLRTTLPHGPKVAHT